MSSGDAYELSTHQLRSESLPGPIEDNLDQVAISCLDDKSRLIMASLANPIQEGFNFNGFGELDITVSARVFDLWSRIALECPPTANHCLRVSILTSLISEVFGAYNPDVANELDLPGLTAIAAIHDLGKVDPLWEGRLIERDDWADMLDDKLYITARDAHSLFSGTNAFLEGLPADYVAVAGNHHLLSKKPEDMSWEDYYFETGYSQLYTDPPHLQHKRRETLLQKIHLLSIGDAVDSAIRRKALSDGGSLDFNILWTALSKYDEKYSSVEHPVHQATAKPFKMFKWWLCCGSGREFLSQLVDRIPV